MNSLEQFKDALPGYLPGMLAFFNLADAKRRNSHLGHAIVDEDIAEFDRLLQVSVSRHSGFAKRVAGDAWLAVYRSESLEPQRELLSGYCKRQKIQTGWRTTGEKDGICKVSEQTIATTIVRAVRCLCVTVTGPEETDNSIDRLSREYWGLPVNVPVRFSDLAGIVRSSWCCVENYPPRMPYCPFCQGSAFDWEDGDDSAYGGSGTCKTCGAGVDIRGVDQLEDDPAGKR